jgi:hypothetical protein
VIGPAGRHAEDGTQGRAACRPSKPLAGWARAARRFLVLAALSFWQGGFTFYAGVVVPVGTDVLGSSLKQGFITRRVTRYLNLTGACALAVLAGDLALARDPSRRRRRGRLLLWAGMLACQAGLFGLHAYLESLLRPGRIIADREAFRPAHRAYLWVSTFQWALAVLFLLGSMRAWSAEDALVAQESTEGRGEEGEEVGGGDKKSSAADRVGVAQSPMQSRGGTK